MPGDHDALDQTALSATLVANSWTLNGTSPASASVDDSRHVHLSGILSLAVAATPANQLAYTLPASLKPKQTVAAFCDVGSASNFARVVIGTDGTITITAGVPISNVNLSRISYAREQRISQ